MLQEKIKFLISQALGIEPEDINETSLLRDDLELDSSDIDHILNAIKQEYLIEISGASLEEMHTVGDLIDLVETHILAP